MAFGKMGGSRKPPTRSTADGDVVESASGRWMTLPRPTRLLSQGDAGTPRCTSAAMADRRESRVNDFGPTFTEELPIRMAGAQYDGEASDCSLPIASIRLFAWGQN